VLESSTHFSRLFLGSVSISSHDPRRGTARVCSIECRLSQRWSRVNHFPPLRRFSRGGRPKRYPAGADNWPPTASLLSTSISISSSFGMLLSDKKLILALQKVLDKTFCRLSEQVRITRAKFSPQQTHPLCLPSLQSASSISPSPSTALLQNPALTPPRDFSNPRRYVPPSQRGEGGPGRPGSRDNSRPTSPGGSGRPPLPGRPPASPAREMQDVVGGPVGVVASSVASRWGNLKGSLTKGIDQVR
jgi:hypothetical protein